MIGVSDRIENLFVAFRLHLFGCDWLQQGVCQCISNMFIVHIVDDDFYFAVFILSLKGVRIVS
jgi:hypothetical protein